MGRRNEGKSPSVTQLWPHHRKMARLLAEGMRPGEVAEAMGFSDGQVSRILGSPLFQVEVERITSLVEYEDANVQREIKRMAQVAVEVLDENLQSDTISRKLKTTTAFDVLDRAGYGKKEIKTPQKHLHAHLFRKVKEMDQSELYGEVIGLLEEDEDFEEGEVEEVRGSGIS